eukprot:Gregarina_sp_Pseudo_9__5880@NODE_921_length_2061_cov_7_735410_g864_i0_p2_GENE_NODE_921_length_2061_cov_7_735410_g864_i0NODE_921_length_2061_cov_7_735410_g864_i0_p2_ORF_typecomplete_len241_score50_00Mt_ATPsynt_B/PF05405_14/0_058PSI/PF01437_25/0_35C1_1/PF00130_22/0_52PSI_integrin/PF17205_3/8_6_NODE_921_length_2061_cov_7_735410_g864_i049771
MTIDSICSYVHTCEQCVSLAERVGRAAYKCSWCAQDAERGRCYLPELHSCPNVSIPAIEQCPRNAFNTAMLVLIALSGVFFLASFHIGYFVLKFFEALVRDTKREQEQREQAEKLLAEFAVESSGSRQSQSSSARDDQSTISMHWGPRQRGYTTFMQRRKLGDELSDAAGMSTASAGERSNRTRSRPPSPGSVAPVSEASSRTRRRAALSPVSPASYVTVTDTSTNRSRRLSVASRASPA